VLAVLVAASVHRSLRHFQNVAQEIRRGGVGKATFASRNLVPELAGVARHFDHLVHDLHRVARDIRRTGEENAHAIKTPLAVIRSALEPIKRRAPDLDERSQRSIQLIESSLGRLNAMVSAAQRAGDDTADLIEAPKVRVNLTEVALEAVQATRTIAAERHVSLVHYLEDGLQVVAPEGVLDLVLENILDNALSFSKPGGRIIVTLSKTEYAVGLFVEDEGPGIDPNKIHHIFERNFSTRPLQPARKRAEQVEPFHAGLGLWIVRRHTEALGGTVTAANRPGGGLCVHLTLPRNEC
jgi:two-component system sensor histidine kinase ChvG